MLSGEYAVMHGGTSVLMPVARQLYIRESDNPRPLDLFSHYESGA